MIATALEALASGELPPKLPPAESLKLYEASETERERDPVDWDDHTKRVVDLAMDALDVREIMGTNPQGFAYADRLPFSQALYHVSGGCRDLRDRWIKWSRDRWGPHCLYEHTRENLPAKWDAFEPAKGARTYGIGTIYRIVWKYNPDFDIDTRVMDKLQKDSDAVEEYMKLFR